MRELAHQTIKEIAEDAMIYAFTAFLIRQAVVLILGLRATSGRK